MLTNERYPVLFCRLAKNIIQIYMYTQQVHIRILIEAEKIPNIYLLDQQKR